jgi:hypothetical protein
MFLAVSSAFAQDDGSTCSTATPAVPPDVLTSSTYHGPLAGNVNPTRTNVNPCETILVPATWSNFAKQAQFPTPCSSTQICPTYITDSPVYAQVLYKAGASIGVGTHNIVIIATIDDYIFAYDADNIYPPNGPKEYWGTGGAGINLITDRGDCGSLGAPIANPGSALARAGIVSTPVIDPAAMAVYVVGGCVDGSSTVHWYLHSLKLADGTENQNYPIDIGGPTSPVSVPAMYGAAGASQNKLSLKPGYQLQRQSLTQVVTTDGPPPSVNEIFVGFGVGPYSETQFNAHPYHGWLAGYAAGTSTLNFAFASTPNGPTNSPYSGSGATQTPCSSSPDFSNLCGLGGGIWSGGKSAAVLFNSSSPSNFTLFVPTGNGGFQVNTNLTSTCANCANSIAAFSQSDLSASSPPAMPDSFFAPFSSDFSGSPPQPPDCYDSSGDVPNPAPTGYRKMGCYDQDLGAPGALLANISGTNYVVTFDKTGQGYAPEASNLGGYSSGTRRPTSLSALPL